MNAGNSLLQPSTAILFATFVLLLTNTLRGVVRAARASKANSRSPLPHTGSPSQQQGQQGQQQPGCNDGLHWQQVG